LVAGLHRICIALYKISSEKVDIGSNVGVPFKVPEPVGAPFLYPLEKKYIIFVLPSI
jgi:hypothetical protein